MAASVLFVVHMVITKQLEISAAIRVISGIQAIASRPGSSVDDAAVEREIAKAIGDRRSASELERIAVVAYFLAYPQRAGDESIDRFYEASF